MLDKDFILYSLVPSHIFANATFMSLTSYKSYIEVCIEDRYWAMKGQQKWKLTKLARCKCSLILAFQVDCMYIDHAILDLSV